MINVLKINCGLIPIGTLSQKRIKNRFDESFDFQKFVVFKDHYLNGITSTDQFEYKTNCFHEIVIKKQQLAKSVMDTFVLVQFTSKISNTFRIKHSLLMPLSHDRIFASVRRRMGTRRISYAHVLFKLRTRPERSS